MAHEGGDEEEKAGYSEDPSNLDSARDLQPKNKKKKVKKAKSKPKAKATKSDRSKNYLESDIEKGDQSQRNEHLDTNAQFDDKSDQKKKKVKKSKKKDTKSKDDKPDKQAKDKADGGNKEKKGDRDTKDLDSLNFFSRGWRCLKARY